MNEHVIADADEIDDRERLLVEVEGRELGIFHLDGEYYAYVNWCPHQAGPLCEGKLTGRQRANFDAETLETELKWTDDGEIITCPWHDWEFDVTTGENIPRNDVILPSYPVRVEDGKLVVTV
jgi:nitrite reductase/ring-hydroxylating ferredoxin subunit